MPEVPEEFAVLVAYLASVADPRLAHGKVHPLSGVLGLTVLGLMAGCRSLSAISRFGQVHPEAPQAERPAAQPVGDHPLPPPRAGGGGRQDDARLHVLQVFAHRGTLALDQLAAAPLRGAADAARAWVAAVAETFPGPRMLTGDAIFAEQSLCAALVADQRDDLVRRKKPGEPLRRRGAAVRRGGAARPGGGGQGARPAGCPWARRAIRVSAELVGVNAFPGLRQVAEVRTRVVPLTTGEVTEQARDLATSLGPERAGPAALLALFRGTGRSRTGSSTSRTTASARIATSCSATREEKSSGCGARPPATCCEGAAPSGRRPPP